MNCHDRPYAHTAPSSYLTRSASVPSSLSISIVRWIGKELCNMQYSFGWKLEAGEEYGRVRHFNATHDLMGYATCCKPRSVWSLKRKAIGILNGVLGLLESFSIRTSTIHLYLIFQSREGSPAFRISSAVFTILRPTSVFDPILEAAPCLPEGLLPRR